MTTKRTALAAARTPVLRCKNRTSCCTAIRQANSMSASIYTQGPVHTQRRHERAGKKQRHTSLRSDGGTVRFVHVHFGKARRRSGRASTKRAKPGRAGVARAQLKTPKTVASIRANTIATKPKVINANTSQQPRNARPTARPVAAHSGQYPVPRVHATSDSLTSQPHEAHRIVFLRAARLRHLRLSRLASTEARDRRPIR